MRLRPPRRFQTPKGGNLPEECEDASLAVYPHGGGPAKIALSDGASESAFSRPWARILSDAFVRRPMDMSNLDGPSLAEWLKPCEEEWNRWVPWERIPWHGEAKTRAGALATLIGMVIDKAPGRGGSLSWQALAVGDCCLFVVRDDALAVTFPLEEASQFNNTPALVCSNSAKNDRLWPGVHQHRGELLPGDLILLSSDALACWILQERDRGRRPWQTLSSLNAGEWDGWVQEQRRQRTLKNDDTTLIAIHVE